MVVLLLIVVSLMAGSNTGVSVSPGCGGYETTTTKKNYTKPTPYYTTTYAKPTYTSKAPKYTTKATEYITKSYASPAYYTEVPKYYSAPNYYTEVPAFYMARHAVANLYLYFSDLKYQD